MGQTNSNNVQNNVDHHIVLHLADLDVVAQTVAPSSPESVVIKKTIADLKNAKSYSDLLQAATNAFGEAPSGYQYCFYAPDNSEITNDKELNVAWQEAMKILSEQQQQQQTSASTSTPSSASSSSAPSSPESNAASSSNTNSKNAASSSTASSNSGSNNACHIDVTLEPCSNKTKNDGNDDDDDDASGAEHGKKKLHEYQNMEFELPQFLKQERSFTATEKEKEQQTSPPTCDVLFIGAGPVGLWTAVQLKIRAPHLNIIMLEKYAVFQRKHVVLLNSRSLWFMPSDRRLKEFAKNLPHAVRTNDLEDRLSKLAVDELGIKIIIEPVTDVQAVLEKYQPLALVGSDGSHSIVRRKFLTHGNKKSTTTTNSHQEQQEQEQDLSLAVDDIVDNTVTVKYEILQNAEPLNPVHLYTLQKMLPFKTALGLFEHVSSRYKDSSKKQQQDKGGDTEAVPAVVPPSDEPKPQVSCPAVLIISGVPKYAMDTVKGATFRNPVRIDDRDEATRSKWLKMHPCLRATVCGYLRAKDVLKGELRDVSSVAISPVPLRVYRAKWFAESVEVLLQSAVSASNTSGKRKVASFLVGDSAQGQPYFRALNNGFYAGSRLATVLADALLSKEEVSMAHANPSSSSFTKLQSRLNSAVNQYHMYMLLLSSKEILRARANAAALMVAREAVSLQSQSPIQAIKLDSDKEKAISIAMDEQMLINDSVLLTKTHHHHHHDQKDKEANNNTSSLSASPANNNNNNTTTTEEEAGGSVSNTTTTTTTGSTQVVLTDHGQIAAAMASLT